uniref:AB hydrolase-1 domain-containing protein n=1 Tax=Peronospora matthiolae TaxID=2874970 RepID=A0AAV1TQ67_9STRA
MRLHHVLSIFAAGVIGQTSAASSVTSDSSFPGWKPCPAYTFPGEGEYEAECVTYDAPLCYLGICETPANVNSTIKVFVKRLRAKGGNVDDAPNVWMIPEIECSEVEHSMVTLHKSLEKVFNVYTMDLRGNGRGTLLDCASGQSTTSVSQSESPDYLTDIPACAQILQDQYGDLASFSITSAATDTFTFIHKYTNGASTIVYGVSGGTMQVQRLMQLDPLSVNGYVLDGAMAYAISPAKKTYWSDYDADFASVGDTFMKLCAQDRDCASHFKATSLSATLHHLLQNFDRNPNSTCASLVSNSSEYVPAVVLQTTRVVSC